MIHTELYKIREDGVALYRTSSDNNMMIRKIGTEETYAEAVDVENSGNVYAETDTPIESETELTVSDALNMLGELGVDTNDNKE